MSWRYVQAIFEADPTLFTLVEKIVAIEIGNKFDERYQCARISYADLAHSCRIAKRTAQEAAYSLEQRQLLGITRRRGPKTVNDFRPLWTPAEKRAPGSSSLPESAHLDHPFERKRAPGSSSRPESAIQVPPVPVQNLEEQPERDRVAAASRSRARPLKANNGGKGIAWTGQCLRVPLSVHEKYMRFPLHRHNEADVCAWYGELDAQIERGELQPHADVCRFLDAQHDIRWPPSAPSSKPSTADRARDLYDAMMKEEHEHQRRLCAAAGE